MLGELENKREERPRPDHEDRTERQAIKTVRQTNGRAYPTNAHAGIAVNQHKNSRNEKKQKRLRQGQRLACYKSSAGRGREGRSRPDHDDKAERQTYSTTSFISQLT